MRTRTCVFALPPCHFPAHCLSHTIVFPTVPHHTHTCISGKGCLHRLQHGQTCFLHTCSPPTTTTTIHALYMHALPHHTHHHTHPLARLTVPPAPFTPTVPTPPVTTPQEERGGGMPSLFPFYILPAHTTIFLHHFLGVPFWTCTHIAHLEVTRHICILHTFPCAVDMPALPIHTTPPHGWKDWLTWPGRMAWGPSGRGSAALCTTCLCCICLSVSVSSSPLTTSHHHHHHLSSLLSVRGRKAKRREKRLLKS